MLFCRAGKDPPAHHEPAGEVVAAVMEPERGSQPRGLHGGLEASAGTPLRPEAALAGAPRAADQHIVDALAYRDLSAPAIAHAVRSIQRQSLCLRAIIWRPIPRNLH
jgi:hypothetical protein